MKRFSGLRIKSNYLCDFRDNPHKTKAILCGGLRGGAVYKKYHKTNNKQYVNRGYDSESGTTYLENPAYGWVFAFLRLSKPYLIYTPVSLPGKIVRLAFPGGAALTGPAKPIAG